MLVLGALASADDEPPRVLYIANMGAMIENGDTRILFDPLFHYEHDTYDRVPPEVEAAMLAGEEPFNNIDAVFISHHHGDHFDPATILELMRSQPDMQMFGPVQATSALRELVVVPGDPVLERIHGLSLENGMAATDIDLGPLLVEGARIRHSGWPNYHADVEVIVFRVTLDDETTVMHFGDADPDDAHFAKSPEHWSERHSHLALPPYWFYLSDDGRRILENRIGADKVVGMHVPVKMPDDPRLRPERLQFVDLFVEPGESRTLDVE